MSSPTLTYSHTPSSPNWLLPANACDSHVHVFGPAAQFPYAESRNFTPVDAPKETLFELHKQLGISRCVIVQSAVHGTDNRVVINAIAAGGGNYLGVALVKPDVSVEELKTLAKQGFRGIRFNFSKHLAKGIAPADLPAFTSKLADVGMHLQVHFDAALIHELAPYLQQSAVPVVIDHMGRVDARLGTANPDFVALCRLLDSPNFPVKISGIDRVDASVPLANPPYSAGIALAKYLLERFPTQCLWGTDWPHPNHTHIPDDGALVNALPHIATTTALRQQLLVDNPQHLYQFNRGIAL